MKYLKRINCLNKTRLIYAINPAGKRVRTRPTKTRKRNKEALRYNSSITKCMIDSESNKQQIKMRFTKAIIYALTHNQAAAK